ncbi:MAG: hypothetical protein NTY66_01975, partial [Candidatus Vogelbacteria bacterium]|nr:hypothetical protein [Candidatus Vogelbacteria bacterium]
WQARLGSAATSLSGTLTAVRTHFGLDPAWIKARKWYAVGTAFLFLLTLVVYEIWMKGELRTEVAKYSLLAILVGLVIHLALVATLPRVGVVLALLVFVFVAIISGASSNIPPPGPPPPPPPPLRTQSDPVVLVRGGTYVRIPGVPPIPGISFNWDEDGAIFDLMDQNGVVHTLKDGDREHLPLTYLSSGTYQVKLNKQTPKRIEKAHFWIQW